MNIKETTELVDAIHDLVDAIEIDSEDGKLTIIEILGSYPEVLEIIEEGKDYEVILDELQDLSEEELILLNEKLIKIVFTIINIVKNLTKEG